MVACYRLPCCSRWQSLMLGAMIAWFMGVEAARVARAADKRPPNIIFIMADDLGWTDLGCQGSKYYETPSIDKLAAQGTRFTRYYVCQNCQPTRAALMTGQYAPRTGVYTVGGIDRFDWRSRPLRPVDNLDSLPLDKVTVAQALKSAGYATGMFGKWHLGAKESHHPSKRGFDEAIVSMGQHFNFKTQPPVEHPKGEYLADFLTDRAVDFIQRHKAEPFFLYLPHFGVHSPWDVKDELMARFKPKPGVEGHNNPTYAAMIASVDESVGRVMRTLDELKLADNTVVIFTSDNGGVGGYSREGIQSREVTDNVPLRNGKGSLYDGGIRVPLIVRWLGVTAQGSTCETPAIHVDMFPTFLSVAGASPAADAKLDGTSLVPLLRDSHASLPRDAVFQHFPGYLGASNDTWRTTPVSVMIEKDWKLMEFFEDGRLELYNISQDIGEKQNLAQQQPERVQAMHARLKEWRKSVGAKLPTPNETARAKP